MLKNVITIAALLLTVFSTAEENGLSSSPETLQLSLEKRTQHLQWLQQHLILNHPTLRCKETHGVIDPSQVFSQAIQNETRANPGLPDFYDRVRKLIAQFQDTHLKVFPKSPFPTVRLPLQFFGTASHVYVLNSSPISKIQNGDRVVSFNSTPIEQVLTKLSTLIPGSSPPYVRRRALKKLVRRNFYYPQSEIAQITLERSDGSLYTRELRYSEVMDRQTNPQVRQVLNSRGIRPQPLKIEEMTSNQETNWGTLDNSRLYRNLNGGVIGFGIRKLSTRSVGILQIFTFPDDDIRDGSGNPTSFRSALIDIIQTLHRRGLPLVLDLRHNPGGNGERAFELMRVLTPANAAYSSTTRSYFLNQKNRALIASTQSPLARFEAWVMGGFPEQDGYRALHQHLLDKPLPDGHYTPLFSEAGTLRTDPELDGYEQKIIALIGPECVSTCDMLANMLAFNKRATLIGEPANGTGGGMVGTKSVPWQPSLSPDALFYYKIPNKVVGKPLGTEEGLFNSKHVCTTGLAENRPAIPDITYEPTIEDVFYNERGLVKVLAPLFK